MQQQQVRFALFEHVMWVREGQLEQTVPNEWISIGGDGSNTIGSKSHIVIDYYTGLCGTYQLHIR